MTPTQLRRIRTRLTAFAEDLFASIPRKDQRRWGQSYLRGLLLDGKRKSIQPMAARLARGDPAADAYALEQALQQFVNQSPWDPVPVRRRLARRMTTAIQPAAWVIDDTAFRPPARWTGGCFCPNPGTTMPSGAARRTCPRTSGTGPSGSWPWRCWTSWPAGALRRR